MTLNALSEAMAHPGVTYRVEYRHRHKQGHWLPMEAVGTSRLHDPSLAGVVLNLRDISERKGAEEERSTLQEQLQQATKMEAIGRLAGGVAHDFNNLLTVIAGNVELALSELNPADPLAAHLADVRDVTNSAASLTRQLLAFSRRQLSTIVEALEQTPDIACVAATGRADDLTSTIRERGAQVVIDVTHPSVALRNAMAILEGGAHALIGTTGIGQEHHPKLDAAARARELAVLIAPSFSIAAILMMKFSAEAARYFPHVEIVEYHHDTKADAPSGTALRTAEFINASRGPTDPPRIESEGRLGEVSRGARIGNIRIHAVRLPGFVATQEVILGGAGETLRLRHDPIDRQSYIPGVLHAFRAILDRRGLIYGLENLL